MRRSLFYKTTNTACVFFMELELYHELNSRSQWILISTQRWLMKAIFRFICYGEKIHFQQNFPLLALAVEFLRRYTGCPTILAPLCFLTFSRVLEHIQRNFWPFFNSPGNLLYDSHKNFENWFRNSWDNWGQSWHPSFLRLTFCYYTESKK